MAGIVGKAGGSMKGKRRKAWILIFMLLFCSFSEGFVQADADTSVSDPTEMESSMEETAKAATEDTVPEESTEVPTEDTVPEESTEVPTKDTAPEESTEAPAGDPVPTETTEPILASEATKPPEKDLTREKESVDPDVFLPEKFPSVTVSCPAPLGEPVNGGKTRQSFRSDESPGDNLVLNKTVADHADETFTLTLESYATGTASVVTKVPVPSDVVLVLDESGSMNDCIECGHEMSQDCALLDEDCLHKVYRAELNTAKQYKTYYKDSTERIVGYCSACQKWYTGGPFKKCSSHKNLGNWVAFSAEGDKANYENNVYVTQFYAACDHDTQRMDALKGAVTNFLDKMYASSLGADNVHGTSDDVDHKVAVVGFDNDTPARIYTPKTSVAAGFVPADSAANAAGTLKSILTERASVMTALSSVKVRAATATNRGMEAAELILAGNPVQPGQERNRVVILFTDGSPGSSYENNKRWADDAIRYAHTIKQSHGATVYTIGLFWGADASDPVNLPDYDVNANGVNNLNFFKNGNRFLHLVSSNYPHAQSLDNTGTMATLGASGSYYLSAEDETGLYSIFSKLSSVVTPGSTTVTLDESTVVKDVVTPWFEVIDPALVTAWTESCTGENIWTKDGDSVSTVSSGPLTVKVSGNIISVSNFDYAAQYVAADQNEQGETVYRGKKLVIRIGIRPVAGFLGGDHIPTNTEDSAIYSGESQKTPVKRFPVPNVDVAVKQIIPQTRKKDIYLSQLSSLPEIVNPGKFILQGNVYDMDTIRNGYADVVYTITDPSGNTVTCTIPAGSKTPVWDLPEGMELESLLNEDTQYKVTCTVISVNDLRHKAAYERNTAVNVYCPEILFRDNSINLGQMADYQNNGGAVRWLHDGIPADPEQMGTAPELTYFYDPEASVFSEDTPVRVSVMAVENPEIRVPEDLDITFGVLFLRDKCDFSACDHRNITEVDAADNGRVNFIVHINTFDLRIEKKGADFTLDPNCSFRFRVSGPNQILMDVVIHGNGCVWIRGLPVGDYIVSELTDWSWRYEPEKNDQTITGSDVIGGTAGLTFRNVRRQDQWLGEEHWVENRFGTVPVQTEGGIGR